MLKDGLVDEVRSLKQRGFGVRLNALNTVGYKEVFEYLDGRIDDAKMVELIKRNTRRFAKRQLTWFRADMRIRWIIGEGKTLAESAKEVGKRFLK